LTLTVANKELDDAADLWSQTWGKNVFKESETADLTVNFIFDQRQELSNKVTSLKEDVTTNKSNLDSKLAGFKAQATALEEKIKKLNEEIAAWNAKGGAPPDIYKSLTDQQKQLQQEIDQVNRQAAQLNTSINSYNLEVNKFNTTLSDFNEVVSQKPEAGLYDGKNQTISIYYVNSDAELRHTLIHEFGHALNVDHATNPEAIMYPLTSKTVEFAQEDLDALKLACQKILKYPILTFILEK
jgi:chromosome segregation ATPase